MSDKRDHDESCASLRMMSLTIVAPVRKNFLHVMANLVTQTTFCRKFEKIETVRVRKSARKTTGIPALRNAASQTFISPWHFQNLQPQCCVTDYAERCNHGPSFPQRGTI